MQARFCSSLHPRFDNEKTVEFSTRRLWDFRIDRVMGPEIGSGLNTFLVNDWSP